MSNTKEEKWERFLAIDEDGDQIDSYDTMNDAVPDVKEYLLGQLNDEIEDEQEVEIGIYKLVKIVKAQRKVTQSTTERTPL